MKTPEQEKYVSEILGTKKTPKQSIKIDRRRREPIVYIKPSKTDYMRNCIFWIDEFIEGRADKEMLNKSLNYLQSHLNDVRKQYLPNLSP